jgi:HlyD family secretion protein
MMLGKRDRAVVRGFEHRLFIQARGVQAFMAKKASEITQGIIGKIKGLSWKDAKTRRNIIILGSAILLVAAAGIGYSFWHAKQVSAASGSTDSYQTTLARTGTLTISASGSGTLAGGNSTNLAFPMAGTVKKLYVTMGQQVEEGQMLAELEDTRLLEATVTEAEGNLAAAKKSLQDVLDSSTGNLASAQLALVTAQLDANTAKNQVLTWVSHRGSDSMIETAESNLAVAKNQLDKAQDLYDDWKKAKPTDDNYIQALSQLTSAKTAYAQALATLNYLENKPSSLEVQQNDAEYAIAQAAVTKAEADLKFLQDNSGVNPADKAAAEGAVVQAQVALETAQKNLDNATLKAPFAGTILSIAAKEGQAVTTDTFITIADLQHPDISFSYDETDMDKVAVGNTADVVFDALPDLAFTATVTSVSPTLYSTGGYSVLTGIATLDDSNVTSTTKFVEGMTASVEVINAEAQNAVLLPVEAIHDIGDGEYAVFVVGEDGKLILTVVEVGLNDGTYAEIKSGITAGQTVTTGVMETQ